MTDFGVYVHVPFCRHRCDYCAFATFTDRDHLMVRYVEAVRAEVRREIETGMKSADTVFFGGGTPSRLAPELLMSILDVIPRTSGAEVTVECNPDDVSLEMFRVRRPRSEPNQFWCAVDAGPCVGIARTYS